MEPYALGRNLVYLSADDVLLQLMKAINLQSAIPIVCSPSLSYEETISHYLSQIDDSYSEQVNQAELQAPSVLGWSRGALKYTRGSAEKTGTYEARIPLLDENNEFSGTLEVYRAAKIELPLSFRLFSSDVRVISSFEVAYLANTIATNITNISVESPDTDGIIENFAIKWDYDDLNIEFERDESLYISYGFSCLLSGNVLVKMHETVSGSVPKGIGSDGQYKVIKHTATTFDDSAKFHPYIYVPNRTNKSHNGPENLINSLDINIL